MFSRLPNDDAQANARQNRRRETAFETGHGLGTSWEQQRDSMAHGKNAAKDLVAIIPWDTFAYGDSSFTFGSMGGALFASAYRRQHALLPNYVRYSLARFLSVACSAR